MTSSRLPHGGLIDRSRPLRFTFAGKSYSGFAGDSLASALIANNVSVVGRSFKYHRPRGVMTAGVDEPNALVQLGNEPNIRATEIELTDGFVANPVNCWPSVNFDIGAINSLFSRFLPAGFYYKTFMWPRWELFEPFIRRAAGLGRAPDAGDDARYEQCFAHCDVLVVGSGQAGLTAAYAAARAGARVIVAEQDSIFGGSLRWETATIDGLAGDAWADRTIGELRAAPDVTLLSRTTVAGYFDHNFLVMVERGGPAQAFRERLWQVRAKRVVLATGALERPLVFPGNDRPGVMMASAVRQYVRRFGVLPGKRVAIFTNNDTGHRTADALREVGAEVAEIVDARNGAAVIATHGSPALTAVTIRDSAGRTRKIAADLLAVSGGWNPTAHLFCQSGGGLKWDDTQALFKPARSVQREESIGAAAGDLDFAIAPSWHVDAPGKAFVDFQNDVTADDVALSARESFISVEHLKRYTTLGMGTDQGKTSNVNGLALMAAATGRSVGETGTTKFRFPYTPAALSTLRAGERGALFRPLRYMPFHGWHETHGAVFEEYGSWLRPAYYLKPGETPHDAEQREALAVRKSVGLFEASPLGKIEVKGPDAAEFLDRIYANTMSTLKVGRVRYGLMLNELGVVIDDGVVARFAEDHFIVGTTSAGASRIAAWLEEWLQCEWTMLNVLVAPVTTSWAVVALSGPKSRDVLQEAGVDFNISAGAFPHMSFRDGHIAGIPVRAFRVSFTGEVTFEINLPTNHGLELWEKLYTAGQAHGVTPVGIDAWMLLRTEKGYLHIGADTDGTTVPDDIGWGHVLKRAHDFVGRRSLTLPDNVRPDRLQFVGIEAFDPKIAFAVGDQIRRPSVRHGTEGYVTSAGFSPILGRGVALAMVQGGRARMGEEIDVIAGQKHMKARIVAPAAYDPKGDILNG